MKYCIKCGAEIPDEALVCPGCGASQQTGAPVYAVDPWDHTSEFTAEDISENKIWALSCYLIGILGVIAAALCAKDSAYAQFHIKQAMKITIFEMLVTLVTALLCWTCIVPIAGAILMVIILVVTIIAIIQVFGGKAKEPWLIRSISWLK